MKRFLASCACLALIAAAPSPSAWASFAEATRSLPAGGALSSGVSAAVPHFAAASVPVLSFSSMGEPAIPAAPRALFLTPGSWRLAPAAPSAVFVPAPASVSLHGVRLGLAETALALNAPDARPELALDRLFAGSVSLAADETAAAPPRPRGFSRVVPDAGRNRAFWTLTLGRALATFGAAFGYTALPNLAAPTKADAVNVGYNRVAKGGAEAASTLLTGPLVDRWPVERTLAWAHVACGALLVPIPILCATGHFNFAVFSLLTAAAGFVQAAGGTADAVAFNRVLGGDEERYNRAHAIGAVATSLAGVVGPLLAGAFIAWSGSVFARPLMGSALSFGVYAVLLLAIGAGYGLRLKLPRAGGPPAAAAPRSPARELVEGFALAWSNRFLRLSLALSTLSLAVVNSLMFTALPRYLDDVLKAGPGALGLFFAVFFLGMNAASGAMAFVPSAAPASGGMDLLQRQAQRSTVLRAASWLAYAGVFFARSLWPSVGLMFLTALLAGLADIVHSSLMTRIVNGDFPRDQGKVYSATNFYMRACSIPGVIGLAWLMGAAPTPAALQVVAGILGACAVLDLAQARVLFPLDRR